MLSISGEGEEGYTTSSFLSLPLGKLLKDFLRCPDKALASSRSVLFFFFFLLQNDFKMVEEARAH